MPMKKFLSTTKVSSRRTSQIRRRVRQLLITGAVLLALLLVVPRAVHFAVGLVVAPVNITTSWVTHSSSALPSYLRDRSALLREIKTLKDELQQKNAQQVSLAALTQENTELRSLLGEHKEERIAAGVIARPDTLPYDLLLLDRGRKDGIEVNAPVYIGHNVVLGYIQSVTAHTALVTLTTSPGFQSTVYVYGPNVYATAVGIGGGQMKIGIPQGITVKAGDAVVLPTVSTSLYGTVSWVQSTPEQPLQYAFVSPDVPLSSLHLLAVGTRSLRTRTFAETDANVQAIQNQVFEVTVPETARGTSTATSTATTSIEQL